MWFLFTVAAVEGNCSDTGIAVSDDKRYIASPGYPALITGSSVCLWTIEAPPGFNVDVSVREYLLRDDPGKLFVKIREVNKNGMVMKFDRTTQKGLTFTMSGNVEILLFTHDSKSGHRLWLEYRREYFVWKLYSISDRHVIAKGSPNLNITHVVEKLRFAKNNFLSTMNIYN